MKKILALLILVSVLSCVTTNKSTGPSVKSIQESMEYLASDALEGRATGSIGIEKAAVYIEDFLKKNNIKPYFETYRDNFEIESKSSSDKSTDPNIIKGFNIVGVVEGNDPKLKSEFILLGGHYDHIGFAKEVNGDSIANGANDDASGTIAAMELAAYFAKTKTNKRSILVTLYAAEELGLKGSTHLAKRLKKEKLNAYTMINFEMIGVPRAADQSMAYMSGFERSNFAETLNRYAGEEVVGFFPKAKEFNLFMRSDNFPFFSEFNIPAHAISTFDFTNFEYYHHVDDEADKMDYEHMTSFINKMIPAFEGMMNAPTKEVILKDE
ncbi:M20/M25/M40 family metallo-hydrolase [Oceanihabitans sp. 2_MG-2023]|uniref:M28 family metallopeptidase n=1 Tax=Oceanihabitans sp. 2_MG-2023 TaxID=3062661 RepID=UPI0026E48BBB|nr:M20/M25/M40 family metallo-hydrolase [Oceanihabitans sp. 2_MG-2023]MDO6598244.1 M20/M25/M40 family metallo-hydrolase [Oceanihabitans sp. 2_MG-2023]